MNKIVKNFDNIKSNKKDKTVLCYGHFNVIHPGHIQYLEFAKKHGSKLILAVQNTNENEYIDQKKYFSLIDRCKGVASLDIVDVVIPLSDLNIQEIIKIITPHYFVLGKEHESSNVKVLNSSNVSSYDLVNNDKLILDEGALKYFNKI